MQSPPRASWTVWLITPVVLFALFPSGIALIRFWLGIQDYQYGMVVAALCLAWLFIAARGLGNTVVRPEPMVLPVLLLACVAWTVAYLASSDMLHQLLLPVILFLVVVASAGRAAARAVAEPIACLLLTMPWWDYLLPVLQRATVTVTESALGIIGVPTKVLINTIQIPEGSFEVAEGCAGKKYFMVTVTVSVLAGAYCRLSARGRVILIAAGAVLALATNWLRVIVVVLAGHLTNMQHYLVAKEHLTFGTVLFAVLIVALGLIARSLSTRMPATKVQKSLETVAQDSYFMSASVGVMALALVQLAIPLASSLASVPSAAVQLASLPLLSSDWQGPLPPSASWQPKFTGAADEARASYRNLSGNVEVYLNAYGPQRRGRELVNYYNTLLAPGNWQQESVGTKVSGLNTAVAISGVGRWLIAYVYLAGGHAVHSEFAVQLSYGALDLVGNPASGLIAIAAPCNDDCEAAHSLLEDFWKQQGSHLLALIPRSYAVP